MDLIHGGDVTGYEIAYGRRPLDFSASLNPAGMPPAVAEAARRAIDESAPYPDPLCRRLTAALARELGVKPEHVFCGGGAADVIFRLALARRPRSALLPVPAFAEYERALAVAGCEVRRHFLKEDDGFALGEDVAAAVAPGVDLLFLCQPNNPTGETVDPGLLRSVLRRCRDAGALLVLDECFCPFLDEPDRHSLMPETERGGSLLVLGSFTKLYGMAGIRLGYGVCGDRELIARLHSSGQPWAVSTVAQAAGLAALGEREYVARSLALLREERAFLKGELAARGMAIIGSRANFVFFFAGMDDLQARLADKGVLIRDCRNFPGLRPGYYRAAVRTRGDNEALLLALDAVRRPG